MNSSAYYVRKGLKFSLQYYRKHFSMIFVSLIIEIARFISYFLVFLAPAFNKMQFNFNKMLTETGEANYAKSFDDADKGGAYLTRILFFGTTTLISLVLISVLPLIVYGIQNVLLLSIDQFSSFINYSAISIAENINKVFDKIYIFTYILSGVLFFLSLVFMQVGNYICCASNQLSLGDVFYNSILTLKKYGGKIILTCLIYLFIFVSFSFVFALPLILFYSIFYKEKPDIFLTAFIIILTIFGILFIFLSPIYLNASRLSLHLLLEKCAELDKRVVIFNRKDTNGNIIKVNVLPYDEKTKITEVELNDFDHRKDNK